MGRRQEHCNVFTASLLHEDTRASDLVLVNACSAAENHGRTFFVIYELTGMPIDKQPLAAADWARTEGFSVRRSSSYQGHQGHRAPAKNLYEGRRLTRPHHCAPLAVVRFSTRQTLNQPR